MGDRLGRLDNCNKDTGRAVMEADEGSCPPLLPSPFPSPPCPPLISSVGNIFKVPIHIYLQFSHLNLTTQNVFDYIPTMVQSSLQITTGHFHQLKTKQVLGWGHSLVEKHLPSTWVPLTALQASNPSVSSSHHPKSPSPRMEEPTDLFPISVFPG